MVILGIVGGIAPPSTIEYYRTVLARYRARTGRALPVVIDSVDTDAFFALLEADDRPAIIRTLVGELERLARAGADVALIASNTGHIGIAEIVTASPIPVVSIVDATAAALAGTQRVGLFATTFTIRADVYGTALAERGISVVMPGDEDQERIQQVYFGELVNGQFRDESRLALLAIGQRLHREHDVDVVVLAGTELPLLLTEPERDGVRYLDTGRVHAEAAVEAVMRLEDGRN
ncbi:MAG TPA: amino acid racemase [Candidatus Limnocylindrales bacterium]|nr:amino acid racemase [Candidatus Limnocylindrales bacterium]